MASPPPRTVSGEWKGDWLCEVQAGEFQLTVDEPVSAGGSNLGPQPTDLLLASVASCFALALGFAARKRSIELTSLNVDATGEYDGPGFRSIRVLARIGCPQEELKRLLTTAERVCYVTNTLRGGVELSIEGELAPSPSQ